MNDGNKIKTKKNKEQIPLEFESIEDISFADDFDLRYLGIESIFPNEYSDFEEIE